MTGNGGSYARSMSPRRNRPSRARFHGRLPYQPLDVERVRRGVEALEDWGGRQWRVRQIPAHAAEKIYRCPGCDQEIRPRVAHVVAWPVEGLAGFVGEGERRHWHTACWRARERRRPV